MSCNFYLDVIANLTLGNVASSFPVSSLKALTLPCADKLQWKAMFIDCLNEDRLREAGYWGK